MMLTERALSATWQTCCRSFATFNALELMVMMFKRGLIATLSVQSKPNRGQQ
jgi:hypothetical protein